MQFALQWRRLLLLDLLGLADLVEHAALLGTSAHPNHHHGELPGTHARPGDEEGVLLGGLLELVGLASDGGLVHEDIVARKEEAVGGHDVAVRHLDDVTDEQLIDHHLSGDTSTHDEHLASRVRLLQLSKLLVLLKVVVGSDVHHESDRKHDRNAFMPTIGSFKRNSKGDAHGSRRDKDAKRRVLQALPDELKIPERRTCDAVVVAEDLDSFVEVVPRAII
mmetsp:Transcript_19779/g.74784  ORF Transcript_19779/g.74784 Transcript_19779/m.74784 type:complete len:221 (-) Transcript_19779:481-1143(-)